MYFVAQSHIIHILIPYLFGFLAMCCRIAHLPQKGSSCSSVQTDAPTKNIDFHVLTNISQILRNTANLSFKRRSALVALSSNLIINNKNRRRFFLMTAGKTNLPGPPTLYNDSKCHCKDSNTPP